MLNPTHVARKSRITIGGHIYHVMNRAAGKRVIFGTIWDFIAFLTVLREVCDEHPTMRIVAYCLMPTHWHFLLWPVADGDLPKFVQKLSSVHASRWNTAHGRRGCGAVYQSRYKSIPILGEPQLFSAWRYVERNPLRANLVGRAEEWRWSSLWERQHECKFLVPGPYALPNDWVDLVNAPQTLAETESFRRHVGAGIPYSSDSAVKLPKRGRPRIYLTDQHQ